MTNESAGKVIVVTFGIGTLLFVLAAISHLNKLYISEHGEIDASHVAQNRAIIGKCRVEKNCMGGFVIQTPRKDFAEYRINRIATFNSDEAAAISLSTLLEMSDVQMDKIETIVLPSDPKWEFTAGLYGQQFRSPQFRSYH